MKTYYTLLLPQNMCFCRRFYSAPATFDTHTETKEHASVMSSGISHFSVDSSTDLCTADVLCDERPSAEAIASPKEVKGMSPVKNEQQQNKNELMQKLLRNTALTDCSSECYRSDDMLVEDSHGLETESHVDFESQYMIDATDLSSDSDNIYRYVNPCTTDGRNNTVCEPGLPNLYVPLDKFYTNDLT